MATPTKQELDQINSLLNEIQKKYDQLGKNNPFKGFDTKGIKDASSSIKQLETGLRGVGAELRDVNDEFSNTFKSLQSIVNELTKGKTATNKITNSTRTLEDVSSKILAQRTRGIKLGSQELQSLQKKADISFTNLEQQKGQIQNQIDADAQNAKQAEAQINRLKAEGAFSKEQKKELKEKEGLLKKANDALSENEIRLGNINSILDKSNDFQDVINRGLKREILDRKTIESSIGITGGLLTSISKVTGVSGIFDINQIKADAEQVAADSIDAFRQTQDYIDQEGKLSKSLSDAKDELLGIQNILDGTSVEELQKELEALKEDRDIEINVSLPEISNPERIKDLDNQIANLTKNIEKVGGLDNVEKSITKSQIGLEDLDAKARSTANSMSSQFKTLSKTMSSVFEGAFNAIKSPEAIFAALIAAAGQVNKEVVGLSKSLGLSYDEAQGVRQEFAQVAFAAEDTFVSTKKLLEAQMAFNSALGFQGEITAKNSQTFAELNKRLGVSVETAAQLQLIAEATGEDFEKQKLEQYETVNAVSQQFGVSLDVKQVMEEVGKAGAYGLAQFQGSVTALTEGVAQAKALGISLDQVNSIAGKLLDFESSINAELQAELLLGRDINLEKARLAALNNDQVTLMEEINREMGDFNDFSNMNRIQQEAMADAVGMTVDGLSEALLKQQYAGKTQKEITDLAGKEVADRVEMLTTQERFADSMEKLQGIVADIVAGPLGTMAEIVSGILGNSTALGGIMAVLGGVQIVKAVAGFLQMQKAMVAINATGKKNLIQTAATAALANPFKALAGLAAAGVVIGGVTALVNREEKADDYMSPGYGKRTLSTPEGTIAFNDKDTIVAGTNLEQNSVINKPTTNSMVSNNTTTQTVAPANNARMESELSAIKRVLENIATKEGTVSMNGTKFGTVTAMNTYQIQ